MSFAWYDPIDISISVLTLFKHSQLDTSFHTLCPPSTSQLSVLTCVTTTWTLSGVFLPNNLVPLMNIKCSSIGGIMYGTVIGLVWCGVIWYMRCNLLPLVLHNRQIDNWNDDGVDIQDGTNENGWKWTTNEDCWVHYDDARSLERKY